MLKNSKAISLLVLCGLVISISGCGKSTSDKQELKRQESVSVNSNAVKDNKDNKDNKDKKAKDNNKKESNNIKKELQGSYDSYDNKLNGFYVNKMIGSNPPDTDKAFIPMFEKSNTIYIGDKSKKYVYLTFDEGYENGYTSKILDILKENNVKAAFFITGDYIKREPDLVKRMADEGHIVGNHTMHHPSMPGMAPDKIKTEIDELSEAYASLTGEDMVYFRPPKGEFSEKSLRVTSDLGYKTVFWSFAYADWEVNKSYNESKIYDNIMKKLHNGEIMLLHAVSKENTNLLDKVIKSIKEKGYKFKSIDDIK